MKRIVKTLVILLVVAGLGYLGLRFYQQNASQASSGAETAYALADLSVGSLSKTVVSTGSLSKKDTLDLKAPIDLVVEAVHVQAGDEINANDTVLSIDTKALAASANDLQDQLIAQDETLANLAGKYKETQTLKSPVAGRVKAIYVNPGEYLQESLRDQPALMLFSLDGLMKAEFTGLATIPTGGTDLKVISGDQSFAATLGRVSEGSALVTFSDSKVLAGEKVQLVQNGVVLGTASAEINMPYLYTTDADGRIDTITPKVNALVNKNGALLSLGSVALSREYQAVLQTREELADSLLTARTLLEDPVIYAQQGGIVAEALAQAGAEMLAGDLMISLYAGDVMQMAINVDELDIISVSPGQSASLKMDALPEKSYEAEVVHISQIGTVSSGITNYTVTLELAETEELKLGMNGTATIAVGQQANALLVPLTAVQSDNQGSYVWLYQADHVQTAEEPGIKTYITTGLSSADYVAVSSGLSVSDQLVLTRGEANASASPTGGEMMFGTGEGMQGMPALERLTEGERESFTPSREQGFPSRGN